MNCPREGCTNKAVEDRQYGVLPCVACRKKDEEEVFALPASPEFYSLSKQTRFTEQRDKHKKDIEQPWVGKNWDPNPNFVKMYPEMAREYFSDEQLKRL